MASDRDEESVQLGGGDMVAKPAQQAKSAALGWRKRRAKKRAEKWAEPYPRFHEVEELVRAMTSLELDPHQQRFVEAFADRLRRFELHAAASRRWYRDMQVPTVVAASAVPPLIALNLGLAGRVVAAVLGVFVAAATGVENLLGYGRRWRHLRGTTEYLKTEAWKYIALGGEYRNADPATHGGAFPRFADRVDDGLRREIQEYVDIVQETAAAPERGS
jgi:hypothetical protein